LIKVHHGELKQLTLFELIQVKRIKNTQAILFHKGRRNMETRREQIRIDPKKCTACHRCTIACSMKHHGMINPNLARIKILTFENQQLNVPVICMACENSLCIKVCPMNARKREPNGTITTDTEVCIGCKACVYICPVGSPAINPYTGQTMTCDMCEGDDAGPWCVIACKDQGALTICKNDAATREIARKQAAKRRVMHR
jgi:carbon-monoxide dehydrogenase iron sulfur subunit